MRISPREKRLLAVLILCLLAAGLWFGQHQLDLYKLDLGQASQRAQVELRRTQNLATRLHALQGSDRSGVQVSDRRSLIADIEALAVNFKEQLSLNPISNRSDDPATVLDIRIKAVTLDDALEFIHGIEDSSRQFVIEQIEINRSTSENKMLRIAMRVSALRT